MSEVWGIGESEAQRVESGLGNRFNLQAEEWSRGHKQLRRVRERAIQIDTHVLELLFDWPRAQDEGRLTEIVQE